LDNQRNLIIAVLLSGLLLFGWDAGMSYIYPQSDVATQTEGAGGPTERAAANAAPGTLEGGLSDPAAVALEEADLETELANAARIAIDAPSMAGSINPVGARIDDVVLKRHRQKIEKDSGPIRMFSPEGTPAQQFAQFGWVGEGVSVPGIDTVWTAEGERLTAETPVTLRWDNGTGQVFAITFAVDSEYMITAQQSVTNSGTGSVVVQPFAVINRTSETASISTWNVHSGPLGSFGSEVDFGIDYEDLTDGSAEVSTAQADWIGFTDIYWLSALIPDADSQVTSDFRLLGENIFRADMVYQGETIGAGSELTRTTRLFVGAKETEVLDAYEAGGITNFDLAIDWGWFRWFEKPIFWLLRTLFDLVGNFGVAIILLTVIIRAVLFPIAQRQFASMAAMKAIQPKMKALQERYKDDKQKQQQEVMKLYKEEKVNPLAGCLPLILQIPIFFALYKTLILAIEMRHEPFVLWIDDLSAPDPAMILNLFGLLDFTPPSFLGIGVLAVMLGFTMWLTFKLNPSAMDPMQQQIFNIMPWVLMFVMAPFAAGLLLYWNTSNILTLAQQSFLYSRHPQLKAAALKEKVDKRIAAEREKAGKA